MNLVLPDHLASRILNEARAALPGECCGLLEGVRGDAFQVLALHSCRNLSTDLDRFEMDPADHLAAHRVARENGSALIGCYHSHPDGASSPSARDLAGAAEENFVWLIAGADGLRAFVYSAGGFTEFNLTTGADLVMSSL